MTDDEAEAALLDPDGDLSGLDDEQLAAAALGVATAAMMADSIGQRRAIVRLRRRLEAERERRGGA